MVITIVKQLTQRQETATERLYILSFGDSQQLVPSSSNNITISGTAYNHCNAIRKGVVRQVLFLDFFQKTCLNAFFSQN
jgi:hypothetical protein